MRATVGAEGTMASDLAPEGAALRVAFLSQNSVLPLDNGSRIRNGALLAALAERHSVTLVLTDRVSQETVTTLLSWGLRVVHVPKPAGRVWRAAAELVRGAPVLLAIQRNSQLDRWVVRHASEFDVVVAATISRAPRTRSAVQPPVVVDTQNVEHVRYTRAQKNGGWKQRAARKVLTYGMTRFERRILQGRTTIACSDVDAEALRGLGGQDVRVVPNGTRIDGALPRRTSERQPTVVFIGDLGYEPNQEAVQVLLDAVVPRVLKAMPDCRFVVGGRGASAHLVQAARAAKVELISPVPNMRDLLGRASLEIVPLRQGSGTRLKILEAFAAGVPVVSTSIGVEGIDAEDGVHLVVAETADEMASAIVDLHRDAEKARSMSLRARALVEAQYDWSRLGEIFTRHVASVAASERTILRSGGRVG